MAGTGDGGGRTWTHGIPLMTRALAVAGLFMIIVQLQMHEVAAQRGMKPAYDDRLERLPNPTPDDFLLVVKTHLSEDVSLSCGGKTAGASDGYFHHFALHPNEARRYYFRAAPEEYFLATCYYAYMGNYMADIVIFDMRWRDVDDCRLKNGGCRFLISSDSSLYKITRRGKFLMGDLSAKYCDHFLRFFSYNCKEKKHARPLAGRICTFYEWLTHSFD